jgi:transporter family protein
MRPQLLALVTAAAWGIGGYFEKKGLHAGGFAPQVGAALRTAVSLAVLAIASGPALRQLGAAPPRALALIAVGGGITAGALGILCFYAALRQAPLNEVLPLAFTSPLFGALAAYCFAGEPLDLRALVGMGLTVGGIVVLTTR